MKVRWIAGAIGLLVLGGCWLGQRPAEKNAASLDEQALLDRAERLLNAKRSRAHQKIDNPDQPQEAMDWYLLQRTGGAPIDYSLYEKARTEKSVMPQAIGDVNSWTQLGPGNIGGRTRAILIDPATPSTIYAGAVGGGVWKTTNGGTSWSPLDDLMANIAVCTLAFEGQGGGSVNPAVIYAGTGEGYFNSDSIRGAGIFKSVNSGATWSQIATTNNSNFYYVNKIVASPNNPAVVYAATRTGVWKSVDSGANWSIVLNNNGSGGTNGTVVFTSAGIQDLAIRTDLTTDTLICSNRSDGIYRSLNAGGTWTRVSAPAGFGRASLAIAPSNQQTMYALVSDSGNSHRLLNVYRSTDGGGTWNIRVTSPATFDSTNPNWLLLTNPLSANQSTCIGQPNNIYHQGWYDNIIAVAPHNENMVYAGGIDLFRSSDGGANWGLVSYWWLPTNISQYVHADQHAIVFHPQWDGSANQTMYIGCDGGIFRTGNAVSGTVSSGGGGGFGICYAFASPTTFAWTELNNNYCVTQFYHGRPYPAPTTTYFGGAQDNGTLKGDDAGGIDGWTEIIGGDGGYVDYNRANISVLFGETQNKNLRRSVGGSGFSDIVNGVGQVTEASGNFAFICAFRTDPSNGEIVWYGGNRPWRSNNASSAGTPSAVTWTQAGAALSGTISAWAIAPTNSNKVYVGTSNGSVYRTTTALTDTSVSVWTNISPTISGNKFISWIEVDPNDPSGDTVYVTNSSFNPGNHVYRTTTGTAPWTNLTNNLPDLPTHCVTIQPGQPTNVYVGTDLGVFISQNSGASWASVNNPGFANVVVESLEFQDNKTLYAFTHGRGAWRAAIQGPNKAETWKEYK